MNYQVLLSLGFLKNNMNLSNNTNVKKKELINTLRAKGIQDKHILNAFASVNREDFIDNTLYDKAYSDIALPIGDGQTISQPYTIAIMLELLEIRPNLKVLEIGTGSGYLTALLVQLGLQVFTIERSKLLYENTKLVFDKLDIKCEFRLGDGTEGWIEYAPYHRVIISAASPDFPSYLSSQLYENAIVVCPVGNRESQTMIKAIYRNNKFELSSHHSFKFVPLIGKNAWHGKN